MTAATPTQNRPPEPPRGYVEIDLEWLFDDEDDPSEITVYSTADDIDPVTTWLTVDCEHAVGLDDAR